MTPSDADHGVGTVGGLEGLTTTMVMGVSPKWTGDLIPTLHHKNCKALHTKKGKFRIPARILASELGRRPEKPTGPSTPLSLYGPFHSADHAQLR